MFLRTFGPEKKVGFNVGLLLHTMLTTTPYVDETVKGGLDDRGD